jgi:hypothetical protein
MEELLTLSNTSQPTGMFLQAVHAHNNICNKSTIYITGFIYADPYFVFSDTVSYFADFILVARSKIILS